MSRLLLQIMPIAVAIAINPVPIIAALAMPATRRPLLNGVAYLAALVVVMAMFGAGVLLFFHGVALAGGTSAQRVLQWVWLVIGVGFLVAFVWMWFRRRPLEGAEPKWMQRLARLGPWGAAGVGAMLVNYELEGPALTDILAAQVDRDEAFMALAIFIVVACCTPAAPLGAYAAAPTRFAGPLTRGKSWLSRHDRPILLVVFAAVGVSYAVKGARGLLG
jgi:hypothetical protein